MPTVIRSLCLRSLGLLLGFACACQPEPRPRPAFVVVEFPHPVNAEQIELAPESLTRTAQLVDRRLTLTVPVDDTPDAIEIAGAGACPVVLDTRELRPGQTLRRQARPFISLGPPRPELGFDVPFRIDVEPGCEQAERGSVAWRQIEGQPLRDLATEQRGFTLRARSPSFEEVFPNPVTAGVLAVAPHQGRAVLEATWTGEGQRQVARLEVRAVSRSRGLPNIATDATVLIGGNGWRMSNAPPGAHAELFHADGYTSLRPDSDGRWLLENDNGQQLSLYSAAYSSMPLDCARVGCHTALEGQLQGGMSDILIRGMRGDLGAGYRIECAMACHTVGEPGLKDGGFHHVAEELGHGLSQARQYRDLPPALQRLANVGCLACHGPGAIPEPAARWSILRAEVCGYCHDAPPRYGHSAAWRETRMSRSERNLANPHDRACSGCHTTWGFLEATSKQANTARKPPAQHTLGITCVACHAVHQDPTEPALLREVPQPEVARHLDVSLMASSRICLGCHSPHGHGPDEERTWPMASASALWLGRGGFASDGRPLKGSAVHAMSVDGCLACHQSSTGGYERGQSHGFQADFRACQRCHDRVPTRSNALARARTLLEDVVERSQSEWAAVLRTRLHTGASRAEPAHASPGRLDLDDPLGRAAYNLLLLLEDPAADVHNPDYTELLLGHTEQMLDLHDGNAHRVGAP